MNAPKYRDFVDGMTGHDVLEFAKDQLRGADARYVSWRVLEWESDVVDAISILLVDETLCVIRERLQTTGWVFRRSTSYVIEVVYRGPSVDDTLASYLRCCAVGEDEAAAATARSWIDRKLVEISQDRANRSKAYTTLGIH